jgi:DNA-binding XRE family transcriptional regulator
MGRFAQFGEGTMTFGEKLRELRERAELTQEQLAQSSGVNLWTIRGYEQGRREPNWKGAIDLARALGVAVEAFAECTSKDEAGEVRSTPTSEPAGKSTRKPSDKGAMKGTNPRRKKK